MKPLVLHLHNRQQAWALLQSQLYPFLKQSLREGVVLVLTVALKLRTPAQNRRYWGKGVLWQVANQAAPGGKLYSEDSWHELFKRKFIGVIELPDGSVIGKSSTGLNTKEFSDFCTEVEAYAATELGVVFYELEPQP